MYVFVCIDSQGASEPGSVRQLPAMSDALQRRDCLQTRAGPAGDAIPGVSSGGKID